ncbi:MAG: TetR/AcrR family transcriptional regulator [Gordonia sp. (in: high G+C Gram-positive bacteria)]
MADGGDGRTQRWESHKLERRQKILRSAMDLLSSEGRGAGVREIAEHAGVPRSVVYRIFRDREDLDEQLRGAIVDDLMATLAPSLVPHDTIEKTIRDAVSSYVGWIEANPKLHHFLSTGSATKPTIGSRVVASTRVAIGRQLAEVARTVLTAVGADPRYGESIAFALTGMVDSTVNRWLTQSDPDLTAAELSEFLQQAAWQLICATSNRDGVVLTPETRLADLVADPADSSAATPVTAPTT